MKKLLALMLLIILPLSFLIFHNKGNELLKPYLSSYIESQIEENITIEIQHLKIDAKKIQFTTIINKKTLLQAKGDFSLFTRTLDLNYTINSDGFKSKDISLDTKTALIGTVKGSFDNIYVKGEAKVDTFESKLTYKFQHKEKLIKKLHIDMDKGDVTELLHIAMQPPYAKGKIDLHIYIPVLKGKQSRGNADITLYETILNEKTIKKEFQIELPPKIKVSSVIHANINTQTVIANGKLHTSLANLDFKKAEYNLKTQILESDYHLKITDLLKLQSVTKQKLYGALELTGSVTKKEKQFTAKGQSKSLGGLTHVSIQDKQLNVNLKKVDMAKILYLIGEKPYAKGVLSGQVHLNNLKSIEGNFKLSSEQLKTVNSTIEKELNITLEQPINILIESEGTIHPNNILVKSKIETDIFTLTSNDLNYNLKTTFLQASYFMNIPDLSKLKPFTNKLLKGSLSINGKMKKDKIFTMNGTTKDLDGEISFNLVNEKLKVNLKDISTHKLMYILIYPQIFQATLVGELNYNLIQQQGIFNSKLNQAQLLPSQLTFLIKQFQGVDLTKERYNETILHAKLNKNEIYFDFQAKSKMSDLRLLSAKINKLNNTISSTYNIKVKDKDISGKIEGSIDNPDVSINSSQFIQKELIESIEKHIDKDTLKSFGIGEKEQEAVKDLLRGFFN